MIRHTDSNERRLLVGFRLSDNMNKELRIRRTNSVEAAASQRIPSTTCIHKTNLRKSNNVRRSQTLESSIDVPVVDSTIAVLESLTRQLQHVKANKSITRIKLHDFVQLQSDHPSSLVALRELLWQDHRPWSTLTFCDTIAGNDYRQWLTQKMHLQTRLATLQEDLGLHLVFRSRLELDCQQMTRERMVAVLRAAQQDPHVTSIHLTGYLPPSSMQHVCEALYQLMQQGRPRVWEGIVVRASFAQSDDHMSGRNSEDYLRWSKAVQKHKRQLEDMAIKCSIPVGVKMI